MSSAPELPCIEATVTEFLCDPTRSSLELPQMTPAQRKHTKQVLDQNPEIICESYGFGKERKLSIFKKLFKDTASACIKEESTLGMPFLPPCDEDHPSEGAPCEVKATNALNDDWAASPMNGVKCVMDGPVCKLDLTSLRGISQRTDEHSTIAPSSCASDCSPLSTFRGGRPLAPWFGLPPGLDFEVRNTFVHFKSPPEDPRAVQTMPHCMFRQRLLEEEESARQASHSRAGDDQAPYSQAVEDWLPSLSNPLVGDTADGEHPVAPGTEVVIDGLSKFPAFNGLTGVVQSLDQHSGRYNVLLSSPVCGRKSANVKRENLRLVSASESLFLLSPFHGACQPLALTSLV